MKNIFFLLFFCLLSGGLCAQTNNTTEEYYNFLKENRNIDFPASSALFPLQSTYFQAIPDPEYLNTFQFLDSVSIKFNLNAAEKEKLAKNGFVVSERLSYETFITALRDIYHKDLPVMITSDMMLYALHASYDGILKKLEVDLLRPNLIEILENMRYSFSILEEKYSGFPELEKSVKDVDLYLSIPLALLGKISSTMNPENEENFRILMSHILAEDFHEMPLFSEHSRKLDFSQFKPRGHYTEIIETSHGPDTLTRYFKAMMWLGRMDFLLTPPPSSGDPWSEKDILRMNISALLLDELIDLSGMRYKLEQNEKTIDLMVGESDNLTPSELNVICANAGIENASNLLDSLTYKKFKEELSGDPESGQKILSDIFIMDPFSTSPDPLPVSFRLMGQRFIIDSYFFSQLVYDRIVYNDRKIWRPLPSPLDASFILGNNDALNLLENEVNTYHYASQLSSLRKLTDLYDSTFWQKSLYNSWLSCLRQLNAKPKWEGMPFFLTSAAWQHEKLNTQLASWSQLRHDNLLYAKQSYTGGTSCSYPYSYIEPYPGFFKTLSNFATTAGLFFNELNVDESIKVYFSTLHLTCDTLSLLLNKQINNTPLTDSESGFLKNMYQYKAGNICGEVFENGWYLKLLFEPGIEAVVADVHTQPTDEFGNMVGNVLHVGTGNVNLGVFLANGPAPENKPMAFVGPVMSYYETVTNNFHRYTDEEWIGFFPGLNRPDWTSIYLSSRNGETFETGRELPYNKVKIEYNFISSPEESAFRVFPNPATNFLNIINDTTSCKIHIYNIQGRLVLQTNNSNGIIEISGLSSGIYILKLTDPGKIVTTRIIKE